MNSFLRIRAHNSEDRATIRESPRTHISWRRWYRAGLTGRGSPQRMAGGANETATAPIRGGRAAIVAGSSSQAMHVQVTPARGQDTPCFH
jgi:hypothetical protein